MRITKSFFLSIGIHFGLAVLLIGIFSAAQKNLSDSPQKIKLKLLLDTSFPEPAASPLPQPKQPVQKLPAQPIPHQQPKISPQMKTAVPPKAVQPSPVTAPQPIPTVTAPLQKPTETIPVSTPKAPPPPPPAPKVEENYEEENLGKIRSILAERLKYPKNALRLKQQGECIVTFTLEPSREVNQIRITQSSGFDMLDDAAKELIETSSSEFPKPKKSVRISVPILYKLR